MIVFLNIRYIKHNVDFEHSDLPFYFSVGRDISTMIQDAKYGSGFYKNVSSDLRDVFPEVHSFSVTKLKYMKYFYELYSEFENRPQVEDNLGIRYERENLKL